MEDQKTLNLQNEPNESKYVTIKWNIASDLSNVNYGVGNWFYIIQEI